MAVSIPYLPDIMQAVVARVDSVFFSRLVDPFHVFFDKGIYSQVAKKVYGEGNAKFPLVWLIMNYTEDRSDYRIFADINCNISIVMPTLAEYTQQQRDDITIKPRLLPIYDELIKQIEQEKNFVIVGTGGVRHTRVLRPYWGGGPVGATDTKNLFHDLYVDEIYVMNLRLKLKRVLNCVPAFPVR